MRKHNSTLLKLMALAVIGLGVFLGAARSTAAQEIRIVLECDSETYREFDRRSTRRDRDDRRYLWDDRHTSRRYTERRHYSSSTSGRYSDIHERRLEERRRYRENYRRGSHYADSRRRSGSDRHYRDRDGRGRHGSHRPGIRIEIEF